MDITINTIGGNCPVQGDGVINGHPWYFRARGALTIDIADNPDADPVGVGIDDTTGWTWDGTDDPRFVGFGTTIDGSSYYGWMTTEHAGEILLAILAEFDAGVVDGVGGWRRVGFECDGGL